jgi:hypothetical protein
MQRFQIIKTYYLKATYSLFYCIGISKFGTFPFVLHNKKKSLLKNGSKGYSRQIDGLIYC